jgi:hypothetical protein
MWRSAFPDPDAEHTDRMQTLDAGPTVQTVGGRRAMFAPDSDPYSVCFVIDDGEAGPGGQYAFDHPAALTLYEQLGKLLRRSTEGGS